MKEQGNLLLAILLSLIILVGFQYFFEPPKINKEMEEKNMETNKETLNTDKLDISSDETNNYLDINEAINKDKRIKIDSPRLTGSISLKGLRIDDLTLKDYKKSYAKEHFAKVAEVNAVESSRI